jgi:hypothetical protein
MSKSKSAGNFLADAIKDGQGSSIYVSYCRKDKAFVKALYDGLTVDGREVFVEWEDVAAAASDAEQFEEIKESAFSLLFCSSPLFCFFNHLPLFLWLGQLHEFD